MRLTVLAVPVQLIDIEDGFCTLMDDKGETRGDLRVPEGTLGTQIQKDFDDGKEMLVSGLRVTAVSSGSAGGIPLRTCFCRKWLLFRPLQGAMTARPPSLNLRNRAPLRQVVKKE